jgi:hypothetical protein
MTAPWEKEQSILGNSYSHIRNLTGHVDDVKVGFNYVLVNENSNYGGWGVTLGPYINTKGVDIKNYKSDPLFVHEFGHTIQSKIFGPLYLTKVGIPSLTSQIFEDWKGEQFHNHSTTWFEINANQFGQLFYTPDYSYPGQEKSYPTSFKDVDRSWFLLFNPFIF